MTDYLCNNKISYQHITRKTNAEINYNNRSIKINLRTTMLLLVSMLLLASCKKEPEYVIEDIMITSWAVVGTNSAMIMGSYSYPGKIKGIKACVMEGETSVGEYVVVKDDKPFTVEVTGLQSSTTYQYYFKVDYGALEPYVVESETKEFTTLDVTPLDDMPKVRTLEVLAIDSVTCRVKCEVESEGGLALTERGICWNTSGDPTLDDATIRCDSVGLGVYMVYMEQLSPGRQYYVRSYARNGMGVGMGNVLDFEMTALPGMQVDIHVGCSPEEGGTVSGGGSYEVGTTCTVEAVAALGYTFVNWTENGSQVSSEATYSFPVTVERDLVANFSAEAYIISVEIDPEEGGTATGAGGYGYGDTCRLVATPRTGYDFVEWKQGGATVSVEPEYSFAVHSSETFTARFQVKRYTVAVTSNPAIGGSVSSGGTYNHGESCTVRATPADGYAFTNWTDDGDVVSEEADYTFAVTGNRNLVANFEELQENEYSIQVSAEPTEGGTVTGGGTYTEGSSCTVTAAGKPGYTFVNWTENGSQVSDLSEYTFPVTRNRVLVAHFEAEAPAEYTVSVSVDPTEGGTVTGGGTYEQGQQCTVTATANDGYTFANWTENGNEVSANANYTFIVNGDRTLVANFTIKSYTIGVSAAPTNGGTVSGGGTYNHGESCTVSAIANNGYTFTNWTEDGNVVSTDANYQFTVTGDRTLTANFAEQAPNTYNINVSANPSNGGTVSGGGTYNQGASCTVSATAATGYTFLRWTENGNTVEGAGASYTFTVSGNRTLVAQFQVKSYTIGVSSNPSNGGTVNGGGSYNHGQSCTLTANANNGYAFVRWTKNGNQVSTQNPYSFNVTESGSYVAQFTSETYTISAYANPSNGGTINGEGTYNYGQNCTLTANPATGKAFQKWTKGGVQVSTDSTYTFMVTENATYVAHFITGSYTITATADPSDGGIVSGTGTHYYGNQCTLTATRRPGYTFVNWTENGQVIQGEDNSYSFTVTGDRTLVAHFAPSSPTQEVFIGNGDIPYGYFPFSTFQDYTLGTCLYRASELQNAGMNTSPITGIGFFATTGTTTQTGIRIWMANVSNDVVSSTSPLVNGMTLVYTGSCTPGFGWNYFVFNHNNFSWDGHSNILIICQRNHNGLGGMMQWQSHEAGFNCVGYNYNHEQPYNAETTTYELNITNVRPNTIFIK